ncbi:MAG: hypothetical protein AB1405_17135 [Bdellovibrionota bacterium]
MQGFPRIIVGYHGCARLLAEKLLSGRMPVRRWPTSENAYDWLGRGIYFWEHAPARAWEWAKQRHGKNAAIVGAVLVLGDCFDLTEIEFTKLLGAAYLRLRRNFESHGENLPRNAGRTPLRERRELDCLVINYCIEGIQAASGPRYDTVRSPFWEGPEAFPGSMFQRESHIQIAVRNPNCIKGVFRPNY